MWIKASWGAASKLQEKNKMYIKLVWSRVGYFGLTAPGLNTNHGLVGYAAEVFLLICLLRGCSMFDD